MSSSSQNLAKMKENKFSLLNYYLTRTRRMGLVTTEDKIFQCIFLRWKVDAECTEQKPQTAGLRI